MYFITVSVFSDSFKSDFFVQVFSGVVLSMSQVYGISQAPTAILIYLAVIVYSPISAAFAVLGAAIGTLTGRPCDFQFQC